MSTTKSNVEPQSDLWVPMRDGIRLAADLYLPAGDGPWPTILIRTPYDKTAQTVGPRWAAHGYACLIQDCRGRYNSEGTFYKYLNEAKDGYDTVEWAAGQPWCDSQVGTTGVSYLCHVQTFMAALNPPHLKAMFCIKGGFYNAHTCGIRQGGAFEFRQVVWAFRQASLSQEAQRDPAVRKAFEQAEFMEPGRVYPIEVICYPTSNRFQTGHRIRVDVSSSNYPHFDPNPNTAAPLGVGQHTAVAENSVHHSRERPSHVVLPVVVG